MGGHHVPGGCGGMGPNNKCGQGIDCNFCDAPPSPSCHICSMCSVWLIFCFLSQDRKEADGPEREELALENVGVVSANKIVWFCLPFHMRGKRTLSM